MAAPEQICAAAEAAAAARPHRRGRAWLLSPVLEAVLATRGLRSFAEDQLGADVRHGVALGLLGRLGGLIQDAYARWIFPRVLQGLLGLLPRRRDLLRDLLAEQMDANELSRLAWAEDALEAARRGSGVVMLGPWVGGVGHEILYWIPLLRWFRKYYRIDKSRIVAISRGGVKTWYTGVIGHYLDVFDLVPNKREEYREQALRQATSDIAPPAAAKIEKEIYNEAARWVGAERFTTLHPQVMFKLFKRRWTGLAGDSFVDRYTRIQSIQADPNAVAKRLGRLPADYVAVNFHFGEALPDTPANRAAVERFVRRLSQEIDVFLVETLIDAQSGPMAGLQSGPRIHRMPDGVRPSEILGVQSGLIAGARALVGTHGGMTWLGQALGRTAIGVRAHADQRSEGARELALGKPDPDGGDIHVIGLEQLERLVPALAASPGALKAGLDELHAEPAGRALAEVGGGDA
jgi:hypothetical protein